MAVVVSVIGVLAALSVVGWRSWQQSLAKRQVESDIKQVAIAMENARNFGESGYPTAIPASYTADSGVTVTYIAGDGTAYCVQAQSTRDTSVQYYIDSLQGKEPKTGTCSSSASFTIGTPSASVSGITSSSFVVSWANVTNATSYEVRYDTTTSPTTLASCSSSPCIISGLSGSTLYYANVKAKSPFNSATSSNVSATTLSAVAAPSAPSVTYAVGGFPQNGRRTYNVTASGGTCTGGATTQWKFYMVEAADGQSPAPPDWNVVSWQTANTTSYSQITNGIVAPGTLYVYAKPRCTNGTSSTEYSSYALYPAV